MVITTVSKTALSPHRPEGNPTVGLRSHGYGDDAAVIPTKGRRLETSRAPGHDFNSGSIAGSDTTSRPSTGITPLADNLCQAHRTPGM